MKSTQLMLALDSRQTNKAMFRVFLWDLWHSFENLNFYGVFHAKMRNLSRHMDDVVLLSPMEVATLIAPYEWARVLLINTWSLSPWKGNLLQFQLNISWIHQDQKCGWKWCRLAIQCQSVRSLPGRVMNISFRKIEWKLIDWLNHE